MLLPHSASMEGSPASNLECLSSTGLFPLTALPLESQGNQRAASSCVHHPSQQSKDLVFDADLQSCQHPYPQLRSHRRDNTNRQKGFCVVTAGA